MHVQDLMSSPPITCSAEDSLAEAARLMWERDCGSVMVTEPNGRLVGIITDRDICMAAYTRGRGLGEMRVSKTMAGQVYSCRGTDLVERALLVMARHQVRRVPVVTADDIPIGLLSLNNLVRYYPYSDERLRRKLMDTMGTISQPRSSAPWAQNSREVPPDWQSWRFLWEVRQG